MREDLSTLVSGTLSAYYDRVRRKIHDLVAPLSTDQLWQRPYPYGNSVGHLLLHLTGNLSYYIGAQIARTGYVRDRPKEFSDATQAPKEAVLREFDRAIDTVLAALADQRDADWRAAYRGAGVDDPDRLSVFLHCMSHADHHTGQMIYLCQQLALGTQEV